MGIQGDGWLPHASAPELDGSQGMPNPAAPAGGDAPSAAAAAPNGEAAVPLAQVLLPTAAPAKACCSSRLSNKAPAAWLVIGSCAAGSDADGPSVMKVETDIKLPLLWLLLHVGLLTLLLLLRELPLIICEAFDKLPRVLLSPTGDIRPLALAAAAAAAFCKLLGMCTLAAAAAAAAAAA